MSFFFFSLFLSPLHARLFLLLFFVFPPLLSFLFLFFFFSFFLPLPTEFFLFGLTWGSFLPLSLFSLMAMCLYMVHPSCVMCHHVSHVPCVMCHMDICFRWHLPHHMALMSCVFLLWCHVIAPGHAIWHHPMCHSTLGASKNVKF